jgi:hypothetical protein
MLLTKSCKKVANIFSCQFCDYITSRKSSYDKHILSTKHFKLTNVNNELTESCKNAVKICEFTCQTCNKIYKSRVGLWKHSKICIEEEEYINEDENEIIKNNEPSYKMFELTQETIINILKQNSEFQQMLLEQNKTIIELSKNNSITNNNINSHNKTFNLNMFLNETCKNAMNITDFVDSLKLQISDLEKVGEVGYIEGISSIIIKNLNAMDITERPIHCTDKKRETMYIRDEDKWEKEDEKKAKLHKMVKNVAYKNINLISDFQELHPDWKKINSKYSDQINKIIIESMGGKGDNEYEKEEKIIKRVAKEVFVDKN